MVSKNVPAVVAIGDGQVTITRTLAHPVAGQDQSKAGLMANKDLPLKVQIFGGAVVISIGVSALCQAVKPTLTGAADGQAPTITDEYAFARGVLAELQRAPNEEGRTPVHVLFEHAALDAAEAGSDGIRFPGEE